MKPNATLEKHFLMEGQRPTEVRSPTPSSLPIGLLGSPGGGSRGGARKPLWEAVPTPSPLNPSSHQPVCEQGWVFIRPLFGGTPTL